MTRNSTILDNTLAQEALRQLRLRLPPGWTIGHLVQAEQPWDASCTLTAPDRRMGTLLLVVRSGLAPKDVDALAQRAKSSQLGAVPLCVSRFLTTSTRARLRERGLPYLDLTGNIWLAMSKPGLFIERDGAAEDPDRRERPTRTLRGAKAGLVVRALVERKQPPGVRELAAETGVDAGYVSRVLAFLESEALIRREGRGRIASIDWPGMLRRWATDAPLTSRGKVTTWLEPRGVNAMLARLKDCAEDYTVTGTLAAPYAPIAPARLALVWMRDAAAAANRLALRPADAGANVMLVEPADAGVFGGAAERDGLRYCAPAQVAADLLTSPGRGPSEGEALIRWMQQNEDQWRR